MDYFEDLRNKLVMGNINQQEKIRGRRKNGGGGKQRRKETELLKSLKAKLYGESFFRSGNG